MVAENMEEVDALLAKYDLKDVVDWVIAHFRDKTRKQLGLMATVDEVLRKQKAVGQTINARMVRAALAADPDWKHKLSDPVYSEKNIQNAIHELGQLFGGTE